MQISNDPVVYLDSSVFDTVKTDNDPVGVLTAQIGARLVTKVNQGYQLTTGNPMLSGQGFSGFPTIHITVLSTLDVDVEAAEGTNDEDIHGDQAGWPVVVDSFGTPQPKPSTVKGNSGDTNFDWIDARRPGSARSACGPSSRTARGTAAPGSSRCASPTWAST